MVLSVVLPAYNEQASIESVILDHERVLRALSAQLEDWEIVCLDDASQDQTLGILNKLAENNPKLRVLHHERNAGIFQSFHDLFDASRGTHVYLTGSDGQWPAENLLNLMHAVNQGADLAVGVRSNRSEVYSFSRRVVSYLFNLLPRVLFGVRTADAGSVKLGRRQIFTQDLISHSPFVEAERIIQASRDGHRVAFVPIHFLRRSAGKEAGASWRNIRRSIADCFRCFVRYQGMPKPPRTSRADSFD